MKFEVLAFKELLGKSFNIPSYQRGYRWERENVEALLNDIQEFANSHKRPNKADDGFYCLQPVVVKKNHKLSAEAGHDVYDLLDGQQRLTTLWLILNSIKFKTLWDALDSSHKPLYTLQYECRDNLFGDAVDPAADPLKNIDLFYMKKAFDTISSWPGNPLDIINKLVPQNPDVDINNVRIIWYEFGQDADADGDSQSSSINVFSRLNYGKIALTDTELVKALVLQSDIYPEDGSRRSRSVMREHLFMISTEWDDIEKGLHDGQLWGMLTPDSYRPANHMELLLRFVADEIQSKEKYEITDNQRRDFHIISKFLGVYDNSVSADQYADNVDRLWEKICDAYNAIRNWYVNDEFYHLVGLLALMQPGSNPLPLIKDIYRSYTTGNSDKSAFKDYLKERVGDAIRITENNDDDDKHRRLLELDELKYGEQNNRIIKILEAFNVYQHIVNRFVDSRFNFKKFKDFKVTSLEHIHPQHLNFSDTVKYDDVKVWFDTARSIVESDSEYDDNSPVARQVEKLETLLSDKEQFKKGQVREMCQTCVEHIDAYFDKKAGMDSGHMHTLYNMALVDKDTNAALGNNLIDTKRRILQERENEGNTYVPLGTRYAFNKHFSKTVADMKFWSKNDREEYFSHVSDAYHYFTDKTSNNGK